MSRSAADKATDAAEALLAWLRQAGAGPTGAPGPTGAAAAGRPEVDSPVEIPDPQDDVAAPHQAAPDATIAIDDAGSIPVALDQPEAWPARDGVAIMRPAGSNECSDADRNAAPLGRPHPDWLHHRLTVSGPAADRTGFRAAAAGAGSIPWQLDWDRLTEDWFHWLVSPPAPQQRTLSLAGARVLAGQLREAAARRHALAVARVGHSRACPFDLHALIPVPDRLLRRGPDDPASVAWLWEHWGTTQALRHVAAESPGPRTARRQDALTFWSADWTPWRALAQLRQRWPALRFDLRPTYGPS
jgi:hypothetical protein